MYRPVEEMVPRVELPPAMPETSQFTAVFVVPETPAANCTDCPTCRLALVGEIETETDVVAGMIVTVAFA